jgi:hypothetical protein
MPSPLTPGPFPLTLGKKMRRRDFVISLIGALTVWPLAVRAAPAAAKHRHTLSLTTTQRSEIWRALRKDAGVTGEPDGLKIGDAIPDTMRLLSFGHRLRRRIPAIRPYSYTFLHDQVLIVDPATKKIVFIIGP